MEAAKPLDLGWHLDVAWAEGVGGGGGRRIKCWSEEDRGGECSAVLWCGEEHSPHGKRKSSKVKLEI